jgi:hypothetical protein
VNDSNHPVPKYALTLCSSSKKMDNLVERLKVSQINFNLRCVIYKQNNFWTKELKSVYLLETLYTKSIAEIQQVLA